MANSVKNIQRRFGFYAVFCHFFDWMLWLGVLKGLGFMLPTFTEQFAAQTWLIGWMIAIIAGVMNLSGIFAAPLSFIFGMRAIVVASGFMAGVSLIASSFASGMVQITVLLALGFGLIHDTTGNYDVAFIIMGCVNVLPLVALLVERIRPNQDA